MVLGIVDWRVLVIGYLVGYSNVQAAQRPFKLSHESTLDRMSVSLLVFLYSAHIGMDDSGKANTNGPLVIILIVSALVLLIMTIRGRRITKQLIRCVNRLA